jgi:hypothetical protein
LRTVERVLGFSDASSSLLSAALKWQNNSFYRPPSFRWKPSFQNLNALQKLRIVQGRGEHAISYPQAFPSISDISFTFEDDGDSEIEAESHSSDESDASSDS